MISLIVCTKSFTEFNNFKDVSFGKLGVVGEIISINNSLGLYSISKAYNEGARMAKFDLLAFVHEDVFFHTLNWGKILVELFSNLNSPGVLGMAGSSYIPISPSDWWLGLPKYLHTNFLSNEKGGVENSGMLYNLGKQIPHPVFALDGMFLAMKKSVWEEFNFDESLEGFHGYDTSICYRVSQKYQNYFVPGILIEHFSKGYPNETWLINTVKANLSIKSHIDDLRKISIDKNLEVKAYHLFLNQLRKFSSSYIYMVRKSTFYLKRSLEHFFDFRLIFLWLRFQFVFLKKVLKK